MFSYSIWRHLRLGTRTFVRHKHRPDHWSVLQKKNHAVDKALEHFDDFYKKIYNKKWPDIRAGLLGKQKYVAVINNYGDQEGAISNLELRGAVNLRTMFKLEKGYLSEKFAKKKRAKELEKIWRLEREMTPSGATTEAVGKAPELSAKQFSLASSLEGAEYDTRRFIDSSDPLSAEILNDFVPATRLKGKEDFIPESDHYAYYDVSRDFSVPIKRENDFHFPDHLNVYSFEPDSEEDFQGPKRGSTNVFNYYLMDGGSILPVLALDLKPGHRLLDLCAAPGGKSLLAIQTLYPQCVVANDLSFSRVERIHSVFDQYLYDFEERFIQTGRIKITHCDGRFFPDDNFDRVLVDVPCTTDRHSVMINDNNIFKPSRIKERLKLPETQSELLFQALKLVKPGGVVVYSTCSLSPIQNDGVVHMALKRIWEETDCKIVVKDMRIALLQAKGLYNFADHSLLKYGSLVTPDMSKNFGPTYFCKLEKLQ